MRRASLERSCASDILTEQLTPIYDRQAQYNDTFATLTKDDAIFVIVLTYQGCGSSYLVDILNRNPDVFYMYEPFRLMKDKGMPFPRPIEADRDILQKEVQMYEQLNRCELDRLPIGSNLMEDEMVVEYNRPMERYSSCLKLKKPVDYCIQEAVDICTNRKVKMTKVVRGTMEGIGAFLEKQTTTKNIKIIHLLRDPRGEINSRMHTKWAGYKHLSFKKKRIFVRDMCDRMSKDVLIRQKLEKLYPGVFMNITHEEYSSHPKLFYEIFKFIGLKLEINEFVPIIESGGFDVNKWVKDLDRDIAEMIDEVCAKTYAQIGYTPMSIKDMSVRHVRD
ncbi:unnamed protein product [Owenia fusiformis]|uniref:Uncharacterized protein n=1 Tax=Owenia fusiformis TaxID=6347 RepID=A0A8J1UQ70_OWEFU|nr:unnamed protein product [Owenia fusiformis]